MKIAIITGGATGERQVSISSANNIQTLLDKQASVFVFPEDEQKFMSEYSNFDIVIPMIHGRGAEDGELQNLLESINMPYIFSSPAVHAVGIDKIATKKVVQQLDMLTPREFSLETPTFPVFAKPQHGGSTVSSAVCNSFEELKNLMTNSSEAFLLEEVISGREFSVGAIDKSGECIALPVTEIIHNGVFDYDSKYNPDKLAQEICPADIDTSLAQRLQKLAVAVHTLLGVKHISRSDFIVTTDGSVYFLEINTIPGMTKTSLIPNMMSAVGVDLGDQLLEWCKEVVRK
jgi:D-alanine-D-alanine ligase